MMSDPSSRRPQEPPLRDEAPAATATHHEPWPQAEDSAAGPLDGTSRHYGGLTLDERKRQRRQKLIEAGVQVFGTEGYHGATVRAICKQSGLTERYFYESFINMGVLFAATHEHLNKELMALTVQRLARAPDQPLETARLALSTYFEFIRDDPRRARIMLIDFFHSGPETRDVASAAVKSFADLMRGFLDEQLPEAQARGLSTDLMAAGLIGLNVHIALQWALEGFATPLDTVINTALCAYQSLAHQPQ